jgi:nitroreductase
MDFSEVIKTRRSVRSYRGDLIPADARVKVPGTMPSF